LHDRTAPELARDSGYWEALRSPLAPLLCVVSVEGALSMGAFPFTSGLMESRFHSAPLEIGLTLAAAGATQVLLAKGLPWLLRRLGEAKLMLLGGGAMASAYLLCSFAPTPVWVGLAAAALGGGFTCCHSTLQARATEAFPQARGRSLALFAFSLFVGGAVGTVLMAKLSEQFGYRISFAAASAALALFAYAAPRVSAPRRMSADGVLEGRPLSEC
jgi:MFS family permease